MPVSSLLISDAFKSGLQQAKINSLEELIQLPITELINLKWFTSELLEELTELIITARDNGQSIDRDKK